jgi:hypothetical protein
MGVVAEVLEPRLSLLGQEYVLVQAWKKTAAYIRYHNWFSDILELDRTAVNLPAFLAELIDALRRPDEWNNDPLRMVPAPKSQRWRVLPTGVWEARDKNATAARLRPLAHVSLKDQVVATALMLCLADRVETSQGDPRSSIRDPAARNRVVSYGNRLFCDAVDGELHHRWGSVKLYRAYYQDHQAFLSRPEIVAESIPMARGRRAIIVQSDLQQFYDRVRPSMLASKLGYLQRPWDDALFFDFAARVLNWRWDQKDEGEATAYAQQAGFGDFSSVGLPQGLVSSGFFANIVLLDFDEMMREAFHTKIASGIWIEDACRYVDDLRLVVSARKSIELQQVEKQVHGWLKRLLNESAGGLEPSEEKTSAVELGRGERPLVRQIAKMKRIQSAVSGGFDAIGGEEILLAIQGLVLSQKRLGQEPVMQGWRYSPVPDVRDETVMRFAAGRFRSTFRSLRPLLEEADPRVLKDFSTIRASEGDRFRLYRTRSALDEEARVFALGLIERWVEDPSNVRLLRIGLDLWPDREILKAVLDLLRPFVEGGLRASASRRVAWYCLAQVLQAGATETGFVEENEFLPTGLDMMAYRSVLLDEATRLVGLPATTIPWYLRQQALLFLAAIDPYAAPDIRRVHGKETRNYRKLIRFLRGDRGRLNSSEFATLAVLTRRAFHSRKKAVALTLPGVDRVRLAKIGEIDPSFALELLDADDTLAAKIPTRLRDDLSLGTDSEERAFKSLAEIVQGGGPNGRLRNELSILDFSAAFLRQWEVRGQKLEAIVPAQVQLKLRNDRAVAYVDELHLVRSRVSPSGSMYRPPAWCPLHDRWRFQLGFLLRYILVGEPDFTRIVRRHRWREEISAYRAPESHWFQRIYGLFNAQSAFGDDWLPITDWMENFLSTLLSWPGCRAPDQTDWGSGGIGQTLDHIGRRIRVLEGKLGSSTRALLLPMVAKRPTRNSSPRPLRACIVQTAVPGADDFTPGDLGLDNPPMRRRHRNHLSAALAAVERMLVLRETHTNWEGRLDWLILPELAVHPLDIRTHLVPFARAHKAIVLAGLTYEDVLSGQPLVNSAIWLIPEWTPALGLQLRIRRQGKANLAPNEVAFNSGTQRLQGFRPCQWIVEYPWSDEARDRPLRLTASVCYDATDLGLAADLRDESDIFAIPALNRDVRTFDQMALALHYHMYQLVLIANNGQYGGSNAYWPRVEVYRKQIFHLHGQPQASIAFLEIEDISEFLHLRDYPSQATSDWKYPPAGLASQES